MSPLHFWRSFQCRENVKVSWDSTRPLLPTTTNSIPESASPVLLSREVTDLLIMFLQMQPKILLAIFAMRVHCWFTVRLLSTRTPTFFSAKLLSRQYIDLAWLQKKMLKGGLWRAATHLVFRTLMNFICLASQRKVQEVIWAATLTLYRYIYYLTDQNQENKTQQN